MQRERIKHSLQTIFNSSFDDIQEKVLFIPVLYDPTIQAVKQKVDVNGGLAEIRFDYDSNGNVIYIGKAIPGTATSGTWLIYKFTWDSNGNCTRIQNSTGSWDNRTNLFS